jgi:heat shock protein HtpX
MGLAVSRARQIAQEQEPQLCNVVEEMTNAAGLPQPPAVYVIDDPAPNAFATGRDPKHASVAVTRGLLDLMNRDELQGVIAHEMSHVRNYDVRFATLVGIMVGIIALVADFFLRSRWLGWGGGRRDGDGGGAGAIMMLVAIVFAILAPFAAYLVQFAVSRRRELLADGSAVELTRNPLGLAGALQKIAADPAALKSANRATAHLYIANPLKKTKDSAGLFDTHPPIKQRIALLLAMAHGQASPTQVEPEATA